MPTDTMRGTNGKSTSTGQSPERLQDAASGVMDQAARTATTQASMTMTKAGDTLDQVARAVRESGTQLRQDRPEIAGFTDTVADRVEQASMYLRQHDAQDLFAEAERFARRQPALVVGGGLVAGLILGRILRSGAEPGTRQFAGQYGYGSTGWYPESTAGSSPGAGYGTGYGGTYDRTATVGSTGSTGSTGSVSGSLAATDAAANMSTGDDDTSTLGRPTSGTAKSTTS